MINQSSSSIRVAIAGLGFGESVHIPAVRANKSLELVGLWHPRQERLNEICHKNNLEGFTSWENLIKRRDIDAIIIATPPAIRYQLAIEAIKEKKHLLLEKPVGLNANEITEIQRLAHNHNLSVAVDFEYRAVPLFMQAKRLLENNSLGEIWLVKFDWLMSSRANPSRQWNWYSNKDEGGGVIGALGTHAFDILHWLIGPTQKATSLIETSIKQRPDGDNSLLKEVTSEDISLTQLRLGEPTKGENIPAQVNLSAVSLNGRGCWIEIYGSQGTLVLGSQNQSDYVHGFGLWHAANGEKLLNINPDSDLTFPKTWTDGRIAPVSRIQSWWAESIKNGTPIVPGLLEALESQKVCDQIKQSSI